MTLQCDFCELITKREDAFLDRLYLYEELLKYRMEIINMLSSHQNTTININDMSSVSNVQVAMEIDHCKELINLLKK